MSEHDGPYNTERLVDEMSVEVSEKDFHATHDKAEKAQLEARNGPLDSFSSEKLLSLLTALEAGQRLTKAETGPDAMYAPSYHDEIAAVRSAIKSKS